MNDETGRSKGLSPKVWKRLLPYIKGMKGYLLGAVGVILLATAIGASFPLFTGYAVDKFVIPESTQGLVPFVVVYVLFILVGGVSGVLWVKQLMVVEMKLGLELRRDCFNHLQKLPLSYYNVTSVGYILARLTSDTERICGMMSWGLSTLLEGVCYIMFCMVFMFIRSPRLAVILLLLLPAAGVVAFIFQRRIIVINRNMRETNSRITGAYNEGITGSKTSKTLVIEDINRMEFAKLSDTMHRLSVRSSRLNAMMMPLIMALGSLGLSIILYRGGVLVGKDLLDFGILSAFISYAVSIVEPIVMIAGTLSEMVMAQVGIERISALLDEPITITDTPEIIEKYGDSISPKKENWEPVFGGITFENVWFKYPDGDEYVLEDFTLNITPGTTVAIVGETGAGKSTIVNLACRFFEPTSGRVLVDGHDYRQRSQLWLHSSLGYVLQDPHLFSGTIMENIRYGKLDATDEEVTRAAEIVSADVVAERLADGYDSQVGEGGDKLSTGEKQLVSFARAVLANPPIFVLDEATSSIDTETERLIQNAITHILKGRTSFIIAHRLSTITRADIILVVEDGKIVESGCHSDLLAAGGYYSTLYKAMRLEELMD